MRDAIVFFQTQETPQELLVRINEALGCNFVYDPTNPELLECRMEKDYLYFGTDLHYENVEDLPFEEYQAELMISPRGRGPDAVEIHGQAIFEKLKVLGVPMMLVNDMDYKMDEYTPPGFKRVRAKSKP